MEETTRNKKLITTQEAVEEFVGEQFIEWFFEILTHEMKTWPSLKRIANNEFRPEKIKKFMLQIYLDSKAVWGGTGSDPGFLEFVIANLSESDDPTAESALAAIELRHEKEKNGFSRELWQKLMKELGVSSEELKKAEPKEPARNYVSELSDLYSASEWQTVVGALAAFQIMNGEESKSLLAMLRKSAKVSESGLDILKLSAEQDSKLVTNPAKLLEKIVFDRENKQLVWKGAEKHLFIRKLYYENIIKYLE